MKILVAYATTEGQTRKIDRFVADRLADAGHAVELLAAADREGLQIARFDAAVLAGSVHAGRYQQALVDLASEEAATLGGLATLFLSVSLSAAGEDPEEWEDLRRIAEAFCAQTGWHPDHIEHVAGAFRFGEYDYFKAWMMRRIARERDAAADPKGDTEYTDWAALGAAIDDWIGGSR